MTTNCLTPFQDKSHLLHLRILYFNTFAKAKSEINATQSEKKRGWKPRYISSALAVGPLPMCQLELAPVTLKLKLSDVMQSLWSVFWRAVMIQPLRGCLYPFSLAFSSAETWGLQAWCKKALFFYWLFGTHPHLPQETVSKLRYYSTFKFCLF